MTQEQPIKGVMKDKEEELSITDVFRGAQLLRRLDAFGLVEKLLDVKNHLWQVTSIANNRDFGKIQIARAWTDICDETFKVALDDPDMTPEEAKAHNESIDAIHRLVLKTTADYADLRISSKGWRANQIIESVTNDAMKGNTLDKIFKKKDDQR